MRPACSGRGRGSEPRSRRGDTSMEEHGSARVGWRRQQRSALKARSVRSIPPLRASGEVEARLPRLSDARADAARPSGRSTLPARIRHVGEDPVERGIREGDRRRQHELMVHIERVVRELRLEVRDRRDEQAADMELQREEVPEVVREVRLDGPRRVASMSSIWALVSRNPCVCRASCVMTSFD